MIGERNETISIGVAFIFVFNTLMNRSGLPNHQMLELNRPFDVTFLHVDLEFFFS